MSRLDHRLLDGAVGGALVLTSVLLLDRIRIDDPVGAISAHGIVGTWGLLAVPLTNADATFTAQLTGIASIFAFVFTASFITWAILKKAVGIRVSQEEEYHGVDVSECGVEAYPEFSLAK